MADVSVTESLEQRLQRFEDLEAIKRLKSRYAAACDEGYDADRMMELFVEDSYWESNAFGVYRSRDEIGGFIRDIGKQIRWALHYMIDPQIDVAPDGQSAVGRWYLLELASMTGLDSLDDPTPKDSVIITGNYVDEFVKVDGEWKFKGVKVHFHQVSNLDQGWVRQPFRGR
jgi:hypothetical protein